MVDNGLYRGTIVRVDTYKVYVSIPRLNLDSFFGAEPIPGVDLAIGDTVLCGFSVGSFQQLEIIRKTVAPISYAGYFGPTFGETF